jgi:hypothetical protein
MHIGAFMNLVGPDFVVLGMIFLVLVGIPASIVFLIDRRSKKPSPLPRDVEQPRNYIQFTDLSAVLLVPSSNHDR